ncbi:unnamed protein product, partial [Closterium sp. NIES-54]
VARSSIVLPCLAVPSGSLSGLHLPSFSTNLVSTAALQDSMVTTTTLGGQRVSIRTYTRTGRHPATFTRQPGSSLYTLATKPPHVAASAQVSALGQVAPPCSCRLLTYKTLLWHHHLGHSSLPRVRGMHSRLFVSGLPKSLPPLPPSPSPPCLPCIKGRQRAAPHSSSFPRTTTPLRTLRMDDLPVVRVHSDRGGEFSSDLLRDFSQPLALCLLAGDLACTALDMNGWRCVGVPVGSLLPSLPLPLCPSPAPAVLLAPGPPPVDLLLPHGPAPSGVSQVDPLPGTVPVEVAGDSCTARGTASGGAEPGVLE